MTKNWYEYFLILNILFIIKITDDIRLIYRQPIQKQLIIHSFLCLNNILQKSSMIN